jgi:hypothetical protein
MKESGERSAPDRRTAKESGTRKNCRGSQRLSRLVILKTAVDSQPVGKFEARLDFQLPRNSRIG